jgi:hypothetical protein
MKPVPTSFREWLPIYCQASNQAMPEDNFVELCFPLLCFEIADDGDDCHAERYHCGKTCDDG